MNNSNQRRGEERQNLTANSIGKSVRYSSYEKDKTNKLINYILEQDPIILASNSASRQKTASSAATNIKVETDIASLEKSLHKFNNLLNKSDLDYRQGGTMCEDTQLFNVPTFGVQRQKNNILTDTYYSTRQTDGLGDS